MLKSLFSNRLFIGALVFFVLMVVSGTLYLQHVERETDRELAEMQERLKQREARQNHTAQVPVGDTSQGGHWHGDEWHAEPHAPVKPQAIADVSEATTPVKTQNASEVRQVSTQRMLPEDILSPEYIAMVKAAVQTSIALSGKRDENGLALPEYVNARNLVNESHWDARELRKMYYDTGDLSYLDKCYQIEALDKPYMDFVRTQNPKPKLNSEQLLQLRKAADEFDSLMPKKPPGGEQLPNPYRKRLQEEENR